MSTQNNKKDFFISYNENDKEIAKWIAGTLEENGYKTVIQAWDFTPGNNFVLEMQKALVECEQCIVVLSKNYLKSGYCQAEWSAAYTKDPTGEYVKLIPVRVDDVIPDGLLTNVVYIDLNGKNEEESKKLLINGIDRKENPRIKPAFPLNLTNTNNLCFVIDENGNAEDFDNKLKQFLRYMYFGVEDSTELSFELHDKRIIAMEKRLRALTENLDGFYNFSPAETIEFEYYKRQLKRLKKQLVLKRYAITFFLKDTIFKEAFIYNFNDMLLFLNNLLNFDYYAQPDHGKMSFDCHIRKNSAWGIEKPWQFRVYIDRNIVKKSHIDLGLMQACGYAGYYFVSDFEREIVLDIIGVKFYFSLAVLKVGGNEELLENKNFTAITNYEIGIS